jgi:hypothetical protein
VRTPAGHHEEAYDRLPVAERLTTGVERALHGRESGYAFADYI